MFASEMLTHLWLPGTKERATFLFLDAALVEIPWQQPPWAASCLEGCSSIVAQLCCSKALSERHTKWFSHLFQNWKIQEQNYGFFLTKQRDWIGLVLDTETMWLFALGFTVFSIDWFKNGFMMYYTLLNNWSNLCEAFNQHLENMRGFLSRQLKVSFRPCRYLADMRL